MIEFDLLLNVVEELTELKKEDILSKRRFRPLADARVMCSILLKKYNQSLRTSEIGAMLNINHTSVCHHKHRHESFLLKDKEYRYKFDEIDLVYQQRLVLVNKNFKESLISKRRRLEKMISDINLVLGSIEEGKVIKIE